jgi:hypothetical protein
MINLDGLVSLDVFIEATKPSGPREELLSGVVGATCWKLTLDETRNLSH